MGRTCCVQGNVPKPNSPDSKPRSAAIAAALARHPDVAEAPVIARQSAGLGPGPGLGGTHAPGSSSPVPTAPTLSRLSSAEPAAVLMSSITPAVEAMRKVIFPSPPPPSPPPPPPPHPQSPLSPRKIGEMPTKNPPFSKPNMLKVCASKAALPSSLMGEAQGHTGIGILRGGGQTPYSAGSMFCISRRQRPCAPRTSRGKQSTYACKQNKLCWLGAPWVSLLPSQKQ